MTEPSGFGPYGFTAATGLGSGQTTNTPRWPDLGAPVTYTATVRNRGTNPWTNNLRRHLAMGRRDRLQPVASGPLPAGSHHVQPGATLGRPGSRSALRLERPPTRAARTTP